MRRLIALAALALLAGVSSCLAQTVAQTTNGSIVIAAGNTFQAALAAVTSNNQRRSLTIQNNNTNGDNCWIKFGIGVTAGNATKGTSILLGPGGSFQRYAPYVPSDEIEATCVTTNDTLYVDTQ